MNRAGAKLSLWRQFLLLSGLLISMGWSSHAAASLGCQINATPPTSLTVNVGSNAGFSANIVSTGACPATVSITFSLLSDTTGGAILPANQTGVAAPGTTSFTVIAGPTGGGSAVIRATCVGCFNGPTTADFTVNTNNNYVFTATSPASVTTNQSTPFTLSTNLLVNGTGSGATYSTNFFTLPSGPSLATVVNSAAGNASTTNQLFTAGTRNIEGRVVCPTTGSMAVWTGGTGRGAGGDERRGR